MVKRGRIVNKHKKDTRSKNLYHHLLVKLFKFLSRRTDSKFTKTVLRRLVSSRVNRPPLSLTKLVKHLGENRDRTVVVVSTVTDDERMLEVPKLTVAALRFTEAARARITKAGGKCMTLDEFVMQTPTGKCCKYMLIDIIQVQTRSFLEPTEIERLRSISALQVFQDLMPSHTAARDPKEEPVSNELALIWAITCKQWSPGGNYAVALHRAALIC